MVGDESAVPTKRFGHSRQVWPKHGVVHLGSSSDESSEPGRAFDDGERNTDPIPCGGYACRDRGKETKAGPRCSANCKAGRCRLDGDVS